MQSTDYGMRTSIDGPFDAAVAEVTAALAEEGFGVLAEIDIQKTLKEKIGVEFGRYTILGACNPLLAHQALGVEPEIGLLLPCNVVVAAADEGCMVSIVDPTSMLSVAHNPDLEEVAQEARQRLQRVVESLAAGK